MNSLQALDSVGAQEKRLSIKEKPELFELYNYTFSKHNPIERSFHAANEIRAMN